jgi:ADP-heptose:LPS heptosyltransferase
MKILFFSHDGKLGDAVVNTAFVAGVRTLAPAAEIHVLASSASADFWHMHRDIQQVWKFENPSVWQSLRTIWAIRQQRFDYLVTFKKHFKSEKTRLLLALARPSGGVVTTEGRVPGQVVHAIRKSQASLEAMFGDAGRYFPLRYQLGFDPGVAAMLESQVSADAIVVLVNLFAADTTRTVQSEVAATLLQSLAARMPDVLLCLLWTDGTVSQAQQARAESGVNCRVVNTHMDFKQLAAVCARANLIISPDTSLVHVASALDRPVLGIFQDDGVKVTEWGPRSSRFETVIAPDRNSISGFSIEEVVMKAQRLLEPALKR